MQSSVSRVEDEAAGGCRRMLCEDGIRAGRFFEDDSASNLSANLAHAGEPFRETESAVTNERRSRMKTLYPNGNGAVPTSSAKKGRKSSTSRDCGPAVQRIENNDVAAVANDTVLPATKTHVKNANSAPVTEKENVNRVAGAWPAGDDRIYAYLDDTLARNGSASAAAAAASGSAPRATAERQACNNWRQGRSGGSGGGGGRLRADSQCANGARARTVSDGGAADDGASIFVESGAGGIVQVLPEVEHLHNEVMAVKGEIDALSCRVREPRARAMHHQQLPRQQALPHYASSAYGRGSASDGRRLDDDAMSATDWLHTPPSVPSAPPATSACPVSTVVAGALDTGGGDRSTSIPQPSTNPSDIGVEKEDDSGRTHATCDASVSAHRRGKNGWTSPGAEPALTDLPEKQARHSQQPSELSSSSERDDGSTNQPNARSEVEPAESAAAPSENHRAGDPPSPPQHPACPSPQASTHPVPTPSSAASESHGGSAPRFPLATQPSQQLSLPLSPAELSALKEGIAQLEKLYHQRGYLLREVDAHLRRHAEHGERWEADEDRVSCYRCQREFSSVTTRHHCRRCGRLCCGQCSQFFGTKQDTSVRTLSPAGGGGMGSSADITADPYADTANSEKLIVNATALPQMAENARNLRKPRVTVKTEYVSRITASDALDEAESRFDYYTYPVSLSPPLRPTVPVTAAESVQPKTAELHTASGHTPDPTPSCHDEADINDPDTVFREEESARRSREEDGGSSSSSHGNSPFLLYTPGTPTPPGGGLAAGVAAATPLQLPPPESGCGAVSYVQQQQLRRRLTLQHSEVRLCSECYHSCLRARKSDLVKRLRSANRYILDDGFYYYHVLTPEEFTTLAVMMKKPGTVRMRAEILSSVALEKTADMAAAAPQYVCGAVSNAMQQTPQVLRTIGRVSVYTLQKTTEAAKAYLANYANSINDRDDVLRTGLAGGAQARQALACNDDNNNNGEKEDDVISVNSEDSSSAAPLPAITAELAMRGPNVHPPSRSATAAENGKKAPPICEEDQTKCGAVAITEANNQHARLCSNEGIVQSGPIRATGPLSILSSPHTTPTTGAAPVNVSSAPPGAAAGDNDKKKKRKKKKKAQEEIEKEVSSGEHTGGDRNGSGGDDFEVNLPEEEQRQK